MGCQALLIAIAPSATYDQRVKWSLRLWRVLSPLGPPPLHFDNSNAFLRLTFVARTILRGAKYCWVDGQLRFRCGKMCVTTNARSTIVYVEENSSSTTCASLESLHLVITRKMLFQACHRYGCGLWRLRAIPNLSSNMSHSQPCSFLDLPKPRMILISAKDVRVFRRCASLKRFSNGLKGVLRS